MAKECINQTALKSKLHKVQKETLNGQILCIRYVCQTVSFVMLSGDRPQKMKKICTLLDIRTLLELNYLVLSQPVM